MGKIKITLEDLFNLHTASIYNPDEYRSVSSIEIDSRRVRKGSLFIAIRGEKLDGHDFALEAVKNGAAAIVVDKKKYKKFSSLEIPVITVEDTTAAYGEIAKIWRRRLYSVVIGISGSNGKTSVKEIVSALLEQKYSVVKTEANNNNHIGVPLTILNADENCEALVLELGTNHFNEIEYSASISKPDLALLTNIGDSHLEFLKNREGVYKEKSVLLDITDLECGTVFLNMDDPIIRQHVSEYLNKVTFGFKGSVDVKGKIVEHLADGKTKIEISYNGKSFNAVLPLYGESNSRNFLAACAIALNLGLTEAQIIKGSKKLVPVHGRLDVKKYKDAVLIDDTYNASPSSVSSAVDLIKKVKLFKNKLIILGDIFELGKSAPKLHKELSGLFKSDKNLIVLTIGPMMKNLHLELRKNKVKSIHFYLREALGLYLKYEEIENSVILVKGSRGMKMEEFVNILEKRFE